MNLTSRLEKLYAGAAYDVLNEMGRRDCVLPPGIVALKDGQRLCGEVHTMNGKYAPGMDPHETLLGWATVLSKAPADKVLVCQPNTDEVALMGELSAATLASRGVRGYIVDGASRDIDFIVETDFPVFCRFGTPKDIAGCWIAESMGQPIIIGDVAIASGDYIIADRDGVVVIPEALAEEVVTRVEAVAETENEMRAAIVGGMDPVDAYNKFGTF
jgi:4-hydroxy-4-methyl-2-oxoglutarate aldolase